MTIGQRGQAILDQITGGEAVKAFRQVFLVFVLISALTSVIYLAQGTENQHSLWLRLASLGMLGVLVWRWITWVRRGEWRYLDLGLEWTAIIVISVAAGNSMVTIGFVYTAFYLRPLVGSTRWSAVGAAGSIVALFTGTYFSGHDVYTVTSTDMVGQIPMLGATAAVGMVLAYVVRRQARLAGNLRSTEQRYRSLVEQLPQIVYTSTPDGMLTYVSPQAKQILGRSPEELVGSTWEVVVPDVHPDDREELAILVERALTTGVPFVADIRFQIESRGTVWTRLLSQPVRDSNGELNYWLGTLNDVTNEKQLERKLTYQAFHDDLTGLPNRALFRERLQNAIARNTQDQRGIAILFLDLDNFKIVNDSLGHKFGDDLICSISERLMSVTRPGDMVARLGGDEFILLFEDVDDEATAVKIAEQLIERLAPTLSLQGQTLHVQASIGVVWSKPPHTCPDEIIRYADLAMYAAKHEGKARYAVYHPGMNCDAVKRLQIETDLRQALLNDDLTVYYQPVVDLETGKVREVEALVRWNHREHGLLMPDAFLEVAEETGLIQEIDRVVLREACRQVREWQLAHPRYANLTASVNLSQTQLRSQKLVGEVESILRETGLRPEDLKLEITEHAMVVDIQSAQRVLQELSDLGVRLAIDDFGTGNSALNYLREFPIDTLKIDRSFITGLGTCEPNRNTSMVRALVTLAKSLGLTVTAEGIEGEEYRELHAYGCDFGQGYGFARPMGSSQFGDLLAADEPGFALPYVLAPIHATPENCMAADW